MVLSCTLIHTLRHELDSAAPQEHPPIKTSTNMVNILSLPLFKGLPLNSPVAASHYIQRYELTVGMVSKKAERGLCMILINSGRSKRSLITSFDGSDLRGNLNQITLEIPQLSLCSKSPSSEGMCANISPQLPGLPHTQLPFRESRQTSTAALATGEAERERKENENRHGA